MIVQMCKISSVINMKKNIVTEAAIQAATEAPAAPATRPARDYTVTGQDRGSNSYGDNFSTDPVTMEEAKERAAAVVNAIGKNLQILIETVLEGDHPSRFYVISDVAAAMSGDNRAIGQVRAHLARTGLNDKFAHVARKSRALAGELFGRNKANEPAETLAN